MAYVDPRGAFAAPLRAAAPERGAFSPLEWTVIFLARKDDLRSLRTPSRLSRAFGSVLGRSVDSTLADPRLETLRRVAVRGWRQAPLPAAEVERFLEVGFEPAQLTALADVVSASPIQEPRA